MQVGEGADDLRFLAAEVALGTAQDVLTVAADVYGDRLDAAAQFFVEQALTKAR